MDDVVDIKRILAAVKAKPESARAIARQLRKFAGAIEEAVTAAAKSANPPAVERDIYGRAVPKR